jgi:bifunctional DNase/RNase
VERVQVDILGLHTSPSSGGAYALILKEMHGPRRLPIIIGAFEAQSIALEMEGIRPPRPLTHDLMKTIIDTLGGSLNDVTISELREGTFFARLTVDTREIDSRPSDAIALAVRYGVPIFVSDRVMDEASFVPENEEAEAEANANAETPAETSDAASAMPPTPSASRLEQLEKDLTEAILKEDYEKAAKLRDEIKRLKALNS